MRDKRSFYCDFMLMPPMFISHSWAFLVLLSGNLCVDGTVLTTKYYSEITVPQISLGSWSAWPVHKKKIFSILKNVSFGCLLVLSKNHILISCFLFFSPRTAFLESFFFFLSLLINTVLCKFLSPNSKFHFERLFC